jgi:hypothetical protein
MLHGRGGPRRTGPGRGRPWLTGLGPGTGAAGAAGGRGGRWRGRPAAGGSRQTRERQPRRVEKGERKIRLRRGLK